MSKDWKEFFKIWDYISNGKSEYGPTTSLSIEELYQAFKARLMEELELIPSLKDRLAEMDKQFLGSVDGENEESKEPETVKELIEYIDSRPDYKDVDILSVRQIVAALKEALEIISDKDSIDRKALGSYYEKQNPLAGQWLKKHGFEKSNSEEEIEDDPEAMTATIDKWMG